MLRLTVSHLLCSTFLGFSSPCANPRNPMKPHHTLEASSEAIDLPPLPFVDFYSTLCCARFGVISCVLGFVLFDFEGPTQQ